MIKDLRIIANRNLDDVVIVDNCVGGFANQLRNGIPILPFEGEQNDKELLYLKNYLLELNQQDGCFADNNQKTFKLNQLRYFSDANEYIKYARTKES